MEVIWTAIYDKLFEHKDGWDLKGHTYVWMLPIYGMTVLFYEPVHNLIRSLNWQYRGLIYMVGLFVFEYVFGYLLRKLDKCPWDYSEETRFHLHGLIRFDYAPLWFMVGMALEPVHDLLVEITPLVYSVF